MGKQEILQQIKDAEEKVRLAAREAEEKRKQLQAEGKRRALEIIEGAEESIRKEYEARIAEAKAQLELRRKALLDEGSRKAEALASSARQRMGRAREFVLTEFERAVDA